VALFGLQPIDHVVRTAEHEQHGNPATAGGELKPGEAS
jgi:hypothetical protein